MGCFYHFRPRQEVRLSLTDEDVQCGSKKRKLDALRQHYIPQKASILLECESSNGGHFTKQTILLNKISENVFLTGAHLRLSDF